MRLRELAEAPQLFGYRRLHVLLRREGWKVNAKRVYRLYKLESLGVRTKKRKKRFAGMGVSELKRVRQLEEENRRLKSVVADLTLDKHMLQEVLRKKF